MAVRYRLPPLMREAAAEFASTFILLVSINYESQKAEELDNGLSQM